MRDRYTDKIVMVCTDTASLSLIAFAKEDGGSRWTRCRESQQIPRGIMLPDFVFPYWIDLPVVTTAEHGNAGDALLVEASIGAESQPLFLQYFAAKWSSKL
jgi:hypothetical protein